ncbi:MAG: hypothetical protein M3O46_20995 [Myxococcota bacterium]|nr:hypothetical protein [Myxococcota bacterium]
MSPGRTGPGGERLYSFRDLVAIRVADVLRGLGIDVRHLPLVVDNIRKREGLELDQPLAADTYLVSDSRGFRELHGTVSIMEVRQGGIPEPLSILGIPIGELVTELQAKARVLGLCAACERPFAASEARQPDGPPQTRSTTSSNLPRFPSAAAVLKTKRRKHADRR